MNYLFIVLSKSIIRFLWTNNIFFLKANVWLSVFQREKKVGFATYSMKTNVDYDDLFNKTRYYSLLKWNIKLCVELNDKIDYPIRNSDPLWAWSVNPEPSCPWYKKRSRLRREFENGGPKLKKEQTKRNRTKKT